jgi:lipopolysaccharide export system protein LptA
MFRALTQRLVMFTSASCLVILALGTATAQVQRRALTLRADVQQANAKTGVITANGNVQLSYPARQIQATANVAQYYSRERRIVLSGNVYVLQAGSSLRAETITYLVDEGRFVALPQNKQQVEATILIPETETPITNN